MKFGLGVAILLICIQQIFSQTSFPSSATECSYCGGNSYCTPINGQGYVTCTCNPGYAGNGFNCTPLVYCDNSCCPLGYTWSTQKRSCVDTNECQANSYICASPNTCYNKNGMYLCAYDASVPCPNNSCPTHQDCVTVNGIPQCIDPCTNNTILNATNRLYTIVTIGRIQTDRYNFGWFRYTDGFRMREGEAGYLRCGSLQPFSLGVSHTFITQDITSVPLQINSAPTATGPNIQVKACGGYYVYKFSGSLRFDVYCTEPMPTTTTTTTTTAATTTTTATTTTVSTPESTSSTTPTVPVSSTTPSISLTTTLATTESTPEPTPSTTPTVPMSSTTPSITLTTTPATTESTPEPTTTPTVPVSSTTPSITLATTPATTESTLVPTTTPTVLVLSTTPSITLTTTPATTESTPEPTPSTTPTVPESSTMPSITLTTTPATTESTPEPTTTPTVPVSSTTPSITLTTAPATNESTPEPTPTATPTVPVSFTTPSITLTTPPATTESTPAPTPTTTPTVPVSSTTPSNVAQNIKLKISIFNDFELTNVLYSYFNSFSNTPLHVVLEAQDSKGNTNVLMVNSWFAFGNHTSEDQNFIDNYYINGCLLESTVCYEEIVDAESPLVRAFKNLEPSNSTCQTQCQDNEQWMCNN